MNQRRNGMRDSPVQSASSTPASTPSTVIHLSQQNISSNPDPPSTSNFRLTSTGKAFRGSDFLRAENRVLPTSNFLINRHKLLRKTEEGKLLQEGGTLTGSRRLSGSEVVLTPTKSTALADATLSVEPITSLPEADNSSVSFSAVKINKKSDDDISERNQQENVIKSHGLTDFTTINTPDDNPPSLTTPVHWPSRPSVPPKPNIAVTSSAETNKKVDELIAKQKQSRGILRVPSLRNSISRSRTPSRGASEERPAKKKEEHLHETVVYTKVKPEPPLNGNRHFLLRGRQPSVTRVEVSLPQPTVIHSDDQTSESPPQARAPQAASPSPQRAIVIPSPIQSQTRNQNMVIPKPSSEAGPIYKRLSEARTMVKTTAVESATSSMEPFSPASSFIRPQIRPVPPRKPVRTDMTDSLMEVLPQQVKRPAPEPPVVHIQQIVIPSPNVTRPEHDLATARDVFSQQTENMAVTSLRLNHEPKNDRTEAETPSFGGQMTFDDEYGSIMSSSQIDYDHSSADEHDDLVKRSLVKASNRTTRIENIMEESVATNPVEPMVTVKGSHPQPDYDRLPQRPVRIVRKPSFLSSADESDASKGYVTAIRTGEITSRTSRKERLNDSSDFARDDSAGRRKYNERRIIQRNFEDDFQRKRIHSSTANSFIDSDITDRDDSFNQHSHKTDNTQEKYTYRRPGLTPSRSRYADRGDSDDGASDSVGIPEPLPEYEYPNRIQGRTIKEVQEIRETFRLRNDSSSSSSPSRNSPTRRPPKQDRHFSRHFDITPEELNTARSLIHHRLPPTYTEPPQPVVSQAPIVLHQDRNQTPPPTRQFDHFARPPSQSPARVRASPYLPPPSPNFGPVVHHSDGEGRAYVDKPKKKMGIVRRLSELVRGEKKYKGHIKVRNSSTSSMEESQENLPPQVLADRRQSPVRRYQDQSYHLPPPANQIPVDRTQPIERGQPFNRPVQRAQSNRYSGTFSDSPTGTSTSFMYQEPQAPVYAQPNKLQKQQNLRYRSMSEYDLNRSPPDARPNILYENPIKPSKSIESLSESVWRQSSPGPPVRLGLFELVGKKQTNRGRYGMVKLVPSREQSSERVFKTKLIPVGKGLNGERQPDILNTTYGLYDKRAKQYNSTPVLPSSGQVNYRMAPPAKPPRRYDYESANRSSDSDPAPPRELYRRRIDSERSPEMERVAPESDLRVVSMEHYNEPVVIPQRPTHSSTSGADDDDMPPRQTFQPRNAETKRYGTTDSVNRPPPLRPSENMPPVYARTRIAANDYANRRYHSAAADINRSPIDQPQRRFVTKERSTDRTQPVERQYKSSYKLQMNNPKPSGTTVQERSRLFNNPVRRDYAVGR